LDPCGPLIPGLCYRDNAAGAMRGKITKRSVDALKTAADGAKAVL
jgi:hypothetical protein